tara:strand:+ start:51 stop:296 length:246 start_codon:yes stop_codon:yes gene_type:complete
MTEYQKKDIAEILDNLTYWETCPQAYKDRIPKLIEALKQGQTLPIDSVVGQSEHLECESYYANNLSKKKECLSCGKLLKEH